MIKDLSISSCPNIQLQTQVCIIGGGTAGVLLAKRLRQHGVQVVVLEVGDSLARQPGDFDQRCIQRGIHYHGADHGRSFGLGGTSALWGGQMLPLTVSDMSKRSSLGFNSWPVEHKELVDHFAILEKLFGLNSEVNVNKEAFLKKKFPALSNFDADLELRLSQWLPFKMRNFAKAFENELKTDAGLEVWLNAPVVQLNTASNGDCIGSVMACSSNGNKLLIKSDLVVISAGALESTRLMLELDESLGGSLSNAGMPIGRYFSDHISMSCGSFDCHDRSRFNLEISSIFNKGVMQTPRLELSSSAQERMGLASAFAHFTFNTHGDSGFDLVRKFLRNRQGKQDEGALNQPIGRIRKIGLIAHDVAFMAYWRTVQNRLWIPRGADLILQIDIEQAPNESSRLSLSNELDNAGRKRLCIDWKIGFEDKKLIELMAAKMAKAWESNYLRNVAKLRLTVSEHLNDMLSLHDVYHPTGTLRMGRDCKNSVVDSNLKVWGLRNCYITSTAVFPSAGSANPGLMHLALTDRLSDHIARQFDSVIT